MTYRVMHKFWLDLEKPDEEKINQLIDHCKRKRQFSRLIRDGIRLMWSLGQGDLDVLFELFPWVLDTFYQRALAEHQPQGGTLAEQLSRLEKLLMEQGNTPMMFPGGQKMLAVNAAIAPKSDYADEDLLTIKKAKSVGDSAQNFLNSAFSLVQ